MPKFTLKEETIEIRGTKITVRELTQKERTKWLEAATVDKFSTPRMLMSMCAVDPKWTVEEAAQEPADVVEQIVDKIMEISNITSKKEKDSNQSDAG